jgi:hypothetical protein
MIADLEVLLLLELSKEISVTIPPRVEWCYLGRCHCKRCVWVFEYWFGSVMLSDIRERAGQAFILFLPQYFLPDDELLKPHKSESSFDPH